MFLRILLFFLSIFSFFILPRIPTVVSWDQASVAWMATHRTEFWNRVWFIITDIGSTWGFLVALLVFTVLHFRNRQWGRGIFFLVGVGLFKWSVSLWKYLVDRPRPLEAMVQIPNMSMPSGHATNSILIYGILAIFLSQKIRNPGGKFIGLTFCILMIFATGFSRLYLGVHYPSDILMGWLYTACGLWVLQDLKKDYLTF